MGGRGDRWRTRRALPLGRLADGLGDTDEHERQRGDLQPGDPDPRRRARVEGPDPPE